MIPRLLLAPLAIAVVLFWPDASLAQKERVYRRISPEQLETILKGLDLDYAKGGPKEGPKVVWYDYTRDGHKIRLGLHDNGSTLWVSANFPKAPLEKINQWNIQAKFSRAVLFNSSGNDISMVENQMDVASGATERVVRQFLLRFDEEVQRFDKFINK